MLSLHSPAGPREGLGGTGESLTQTFADGCIWACQWLSIKIGFGDLLSCVLVAVYLALMSLVSRLPLLMDSPVSDGPWLAQGLRDQPISDKVLTESGGAVSMGKAPVQRGEES